MDCVWMHVFCSMRRSCWLTPQLSTQLWNPRKSMLLELWSRKKSCPSSIAQAPAHRPDSHLHNQFSDGLKLHARFWLCDNERTSYRHTCSPCDAQPLQKGPGGASEVCQHCQKGIQPCPEALSAGAPILLTRRSQKCRCPKPYICCPAMTQQR